MSRRLVWLRFDWLPFDAARLGRLPPDIEAEEYTGGPLPDSAGRVQLLVPP